MSKETLLSAFNWLIACVALVICSIVARDLFLREPVVSKAAVEKKHAEQITIPAVIPTGKSSMETISAPAAAVPSPAVNPPTVNSPIPLPPRPENTGRLTVDPNHQPAVHTNRHANAAQNISPSGSNDPAAAEPQTIKAVPGIPKPAFYSRPDLPD